jgi:hypothetical protein
MNSTIQQDKFPAEVCRRLHSFHDLIVLIGIEERSNRLDTLFHGYKADLLQGAYEHIVHASSRSFAREVDFQAAEQESHHL